MHFSRTSKESKTLSENKVLHHKAPCRRLLPAGFSGGNAGGGRINAETKYWEVSYDNGISWNSLGVKATSEGSGSGVDGITPKLRINSETNEWEVSYDNGATWTSLGVKATGEDGKGDRIVSWGC